MRRAGPAAALCLLAAVTPAALPAEARPGALCAAERTARGPGAPALCVVQERAFREGVFLIVHALARNISAGPLDRIQVGVELSNYLDELLNVDTVVLQPFGLEPGQQGVLRAVVPFRDGMSRLRCRFTWLADGRQHQAVVERPLTIH
jgi:hypothetical protein